MARPQHTDRHITNALNFPSFVYLAEDPALAPVQSSSRLYLRYASLSCPLHDSVPPSRLPMSGLSHHQKAGPYPPEELVRVSARPWPSPVVWLNRSQRTPKLVLGMPFHGATAAPPSACLCVSRIANFERKNWHLPHGSGGTIKASSIRNGNGTRPCPTLDNMSPGNGGAS